MGRKKGKKNELPQMPNSVIVELTIPKRKFPFLRRLFLFQAASLSKTLREIMVQAGQDPLFSKNTTSILPHNLLVNKLLQLLLAEVVLVLVKVKELLGDRGCRRLVLGVVVGFEIRVLQGFLHSDTLYGVKGQ